MNTINDTLIQLLRLLAPTNYLCDGRGACGEMSTH